MGRLKRSKGHGPALFSGNASHFPLGQQRFRRFFGTDFSEWQALSKSSRHIFTAFSGARENTFSKKAVPGGIFYLVKAFMQKLFGIFGQKYAAADILIFGKAPQGQKPFCPFAVGMQQRLFTQTDVKRVPKLPLIVLLLGDYFVRAAFCGEKGVCRGKFFCKQVKALGRIAPICFRAAGSLKAFARTRRTHFPKGRPRFQTICPIGQSLQCRPGLPPMLSPPVFLRKCSSFCLSSSFIAPRAFCSPRDMACSSTLPRRSEGAGPFYRQQAKGAFHIRPSFWESRGRGTMPVTERVILRSNPRELTEPGVPAPGTFPARTMYSNRAASAPWTAYNVTAPPLSYAA